MSFETISAKKAEEISGQKLDGRRKYVLCSGRVYVIERWVSPCSGCSDDDEYSSMSIGSGCHECGYTGKRRDSFPAAVACGT